MDSKTTQIKKGFKHILSLSELYRPTYPLCFMENLSDNDEIWEKDIAGSVEKEIGYIFFIYMKILCEYESYRIKNLNFYNRLISNELEHFILRFPVILDILEKHFLSLVDNDIKGIEKIVPLHSDIIIMKKIRNEIIHHGAKCAVLADGIHEVGFGIITYRQTTEINIPNEFLIIHNNNKYYSISKYMTWMICLLLNYLDAFFREGNNLRTNGIEITEKIISEINYMNQLNSNSFSRLEFYYGELELYKDNLDDLLIHQILYDKYIQKFSDELNS